MKHVVLSVWLIAAAVGQIKAGTDKGKKFTPAQLNQVNRLVKKQESNLVNTIKPANYGDRLNRAVEKRGPGQSNAVQDINIISLGESVNPLTVVANGKTNLFAHPMLNTVALVRRGGPSDPGGTSGAPGNKIFFDVSTRGGNSGWQISKGPVFTNDLYNNSVDPHAPRYPQGLIWAPPGSTDTNQAVLYAMMPVLDNSNGTWGGQGRGWQPLGTPTVPAKQTLSPSSPALLHYIGEGMDVTSTGNIFFVDPERDASGASVEYKNRIAVYRMTYNSSSNDWDSTVTLIPFEAGNFAASALAFGPDGSTGYIVVLASGSNFENNSVFAPFVSKTMDGGITWSSFQAIDLNREGVAVTDSLRKKALGSWVNFTGDGFINSVDSTSANAHKVQYTTSFDLDVTVDKFNYCHIFTSMMVGGFSDTIAAANPPTVRNGLGNWLVDFYMSDNTNMGAMLFDQANAFRGCWGDCAGTDNFIEDNRPQTSRSWDGSAIVFSWFDTDTATFDPVEDNDNSNPDLWVRHLKAMGPGDYAWSTQKRNKTTGSNLAGQVISGNVSPYMLDAPLGNGDYNLPVSAILLSSSAQSTSPVTHLYLDGITLDSDSVTANKNFSSQPSFSMILSPNPAKNSISATLSVAKSDKANIAISNVLGQVLERKSVTVSASDNRIFINTSDFKPGIYFLNALVGDQQISKRFVKE